MPCPFEGAQHQEILDADSEDEEPDDEEPDETPPGFAPIPIPLIPPPVPMYFPERKEIPVKKVVEIIYDPDVIEKFVNEEMPDLFPEPAYNDLPPGPNLSKPEAFETASKVAMEEAVNTVNFGDFDQPPDQFVQLDQLQPEESLRQAYQQIEDVVADTFQSVNFGDLEIPPSPWPNVPPEFVPSTAIPSTPTSFFTPEIRGFGGMFFEALYEGLGDLFGPGF